MVVSRAAIYFEFVVLTADFGLGLWCGLHGFWVWAVGSGCGDLVPGGFPVLAFVLALLGSLVLEFVGYCIGRCVALGLCDCRRAFG